MNDASFYDPEFVEHTLTRRDGKSQTYRIRELTGAQGDRLFDLVGRDGKQDPAKAKGLDTRIVLAAVVEYDAETDAESKLTPEKLHEMSIRFRRELVGVAMDLNGLLPAAGEAVEQD